MAKGSAAQDRLGCLVILGLICAGGSWGISKLATQPPLTEAEKAERAEHDQRIQAQEVAEGYVKQGLKFPNYADFGWFGTKTTRVSKRLWNVKGQVKTRNALGAEVTYDWLVIAEWNSEEYTWHCNRLVIGDEVLVGL